MTPDSPETRLAELKARLEGVEVAVRAFAALPTQVGILQHEVDDLSKAHDRLRTQVYESSREIRSEIKVLEAAGDRREDERRQRDETERERQRLERKQDNRWRIATFLTVLGLAITILLTLIATYGAG